jgi:hypothetical protein
VFNSWTTNTSSHDYEFQGIAPEVRLVGLEVLDANGQCRTSDVIRAIEFVVASH